ncbi:MAG: MATE family efflux transporter [Ostreibacterium sp.]
MLREYLGEIRQTLILGMPFIANQLLQTGITTIDSMMAGADSELSLAAVAQGVTLWNTVALILIGLAMPISPMVARAFTKKDNQLIRTLFQQSVWYSLLLCLLGFALLYWSPLVMHIAGVDKVIISPATDYLRIMLLAIPFFAFYLPARFFNEGIANPKIIMYITALSLPINVIGNYIFLHGLFGLPKLGAMGIAISSVLSMMFIALISWWYILKNPLMKSFELLSNFTLPLKTLQKRILQLGGPNAIALLMEAGMFTCVVLLSGRLGITVAAANQVALSYISLTFMIPLGLSMAIMTRVGMAMGEENHHKARIIGLSGIGIGALSMMLSAIIILLFGEFIASLYTDKPVIIKLALNLLALAAVFQIPDGIQVCSAGALRGLEETKAPMHFAILGYWVLAVPLAIGLAFYANMGARGLWTGLLLGLTVTAFLCTRKFWKLTKIQ